MLEALAALIQELTQLRLDVTATTAATRLTIILDRATAAGEPITLSIAARRLRDGE